MADATADADAHVVWAGMRNQLSCDLQAMLSEHQRELQQRLDDWISRHDNMLQTCVTRVDDQSELPPENTPHTWESASASSDQDASASTSADVLEASTSLPEVATRRAIKKSSSFFSFNGFLRLQRRRAMVSAYVQQSNSFFRQDSGASRVHTLCSHCARWRCRARKFMRSSLSTYFFSSFILIYFVAMGVEIESGPGSDIAVFTQEACIMVFLLELFFRILALGRAFFTEKDVLLNVLDLGLGLISILEMTIGDASRQTMNTFNNVLMLRIVRILRVVRIIRVMRLLRFFRPLRTLIHSIFATLKSLAWALLLLWVIMYTFAIVFTQAAKDHPESAQLHDYFGSLLSSILTLFKCISNGVSWELVMQPIQDLHWSYGVVFLLYIIFAAFAVLNVVTGQFCQAAIESARKDDEDVISDQLANKHIYVKRLKRLFANLAEDVEDGLTLDVLEKHLSNEHIEAYFHSLGIEIWDAWTLFRLLDEHSSHVIKMETFIDGCLQLKGPATGIGLKKISNELRWLESKLKRIENNQLDVAEYLQSLTWGMKKMNSRNKIRTVKV